MNANPYGTRSKKYPVINVSTPPSGSIEKYQPPSILSSIPIISSLLPAKHLPKPPAPNYNGKTGGRRKTHKKPKTHKKRKTHHRRR
jgi:hypothetical protein